MRKLKVNLYKLMAQHEVRTVTEIAKETNISRKTLYEIINGKTKRIDFTTITKLCKFFGCEVGELLVLETEKEAG